MYQFDPNLFLPSILKASEKCRSMIIQPWSLCSSEFTLKLKSEFSCDTSVGDLDHRSYHCIC